MLKKAGIVLSMLMVLSLGIVPVALAADSGTVNITAQGDNQEIAITVTPPSHDFGVLVASTVNPSGLDAFILTNTGNVVVNTTIAGENMTGTGVPWVLAGEDEGPAADRYALDAGLSSGTAFDIEVTTVAADLALGLLAADIQGFGLQISAPTSFTDSDVKSGDVTIAAVIP